jgi:hypothetical protein
MSLVLEYRNTTDDLRTQCKLQMEDHYKSSRSKYVRSGLTSFALLILASYCAYQANLVGFLVFFLIVAITYLPKLFRYSQIYLSSIEESLTGRPETQIRMEVREDGLLETEEGIVSFVPWSSIKSYKELCSTLFIDMTGSQCAIIPRNSVNPSPSSVDEVIQILRNRGIPEREAK